MAADAVAEALGLTREAVRQQAKKYGISLRKRWTCPNCGSTVFKPLSTRTGWCEACTRELRYEEISEQVRQMQDAIRRNEDVERKRQAVYSRKHRLKSTLRVMEFSKKRHEKDT